MVGQPGAMVTEDLQYVRTHLRRIAIVQGVLARAIRGGQHTPQEWGEADMLAKWATFLCAKGASYDEAVKQAAVVASLSSLHCRASAIPTALPVTPLLPSSDLEDVVPDPPANTRCTIAVSPSFALGDDVSSWQKRTDFKRLHRFGDCQLPPGVDYMSFIVHGPSEPAAVE